MIADILEMFKSGGNNPVNFKKANQRQLTEITEKVNKVLHKIPTRNITETSKLINAASTFVAKELGLKQTAKSRTKSHGGKEELNWILEGLGKISISWKGKNEVN